jgi:hypothetical protein
MDTVVLATVFPLVGFPRVSTRGYYYYFTPSGLRIFVILASGRFIIN